MEELDKKTINIIIDKLKKIWKIYALACVMLFATIIIAGSIGLTKNFWLYIIYFLPLILFSLVHVLLVSYIYKLALHLNINPLMSAIEAFYIPFYGIIIATSVIIKAKLVIDDNSLVNTDN